MNFVKLALLIVKVLLVANRLHVRSLVFESPVHLPNRLKTDFKFLIISLENTGYAVETALSGDRHLWNCFF